MHWFYRKIWLPLYGQWILRYLRHDRHYTYAGIQIHVPTGVFHPGVFFSTTIFIDFLGNTNWHEKTVLDVGTGSGILAIFTAANGANATAVDINPLAVAACRNNAEANHCLVTALQSDLFHALPADVSFDYLLINPPYFAAAPKDDAAKAFFAGANLEYFHKLFGQMHKVIHPETKVWMILGDGCDLRTIYQIALTHGFSHQVLLEKSKWGRSLVIVAFDAKNTWPTTFG